MARKKVGGGGGGGGGGGARLLCRYTLSLSTTPLQGHCYLLCTVMVIAKFGSGPGGGGSKFSSGPGEQLPHFPHSGHFGAHRG